MTNPIQAGEIPPSIQESIVSGAVVAATATLARTGDHAEAALSARTVAEAGVRAWQIANGVSQ